MLKTQEHIRLILGLLIIPNFQKLIGDKSLSKRDFKEFQIPYLNLVQSLN